MTLDFLADAANKTPSRRMQTFTSSTTSCVFWGNCLNESCNDGSWGIMPLGCFAQIGGDLAAHNRCSSLNCISGLYQRVYFLN